MTAGGKPILLFGAGGLAADVYDMLARIGSSEIAGLVVDRDRPTSHESGLPVLQWTDVQHRGDEFAAVNAIGRPMRRAFIEAAERAGFEFITLVDPSAVVFPTATVGAGSVIGAGAVMAGQARLGRHVFLNRGVLIGHHTCIGAFSSVQAGANIGGHGQIGEEVEIGLGASVIDRIEIGSRAMVGAGSVVVRDCEPDSLMVGVPARRRPR